jgi:hypothetical protein
MILARPVLVIVAANTPAYDALGARIYPGVLPEQPTHPAAVITTAGGTPYPTKSGASTVDALRMQVDVYDTSLTNADEAAELLRVAVDYYRGDVTHGGVTWAIDGIHCIEPPRHFWNDDPKVYRIMAEYQVRIKRDALTGVVGSTGLQEYADDAAAAAGGIAVGRAYILAEGSDVGPAGVVKIRMS